ncbi:MAG: DUF2997 domain-containing protein [Dehalococcoidia bacterium]|nr:DUF2997 domain-containing protein [Dehalococcoidia bacterium]
MPATIEVEIAPDGTITTTTRGVKGRSCRDFTKFLTDALGKVTETKDTAEMLQTETAKVTRTVTR